MPNPTIRASGTALPISSRRLFLAAGTAAAVFTTVKIAAAAITSTDDDPIFAAIERHKQLFRIFCDLSNRTDEVAAEEEGREVTEADEAALDAASEAEMGAADELVATPPVTVAGMRAAIEHLVRYDAGCEPVALGRFLATLLESPVLAGGGAALPAAASCGNSAAFRSLAAASASSARHRPSPKLSRPPHWRLRPMAGT